MNTATTRSMVTTANAEILNKKTKRNSEKRTQRSPAEVDADSNQVATATWKSTISWGVLSIALMWLSFPPFGLWPLAWVAAFGWIKIILQPKLPQNRPVVCLYLIGWLHWLAMTAWVTLPHPAAAVGWLFLAAYLSVYFVGFVVLSRSFIHRNRIPAVFAIPVAWVAMEILRTYLLGGFGLVALSHSQVNLVSAIQISNITGAYGVSYLVITVAVACEHLIASYRSGSRPHWFPLTIAAGLFVGVLGYGQFCVRANSEASGQATIALIQGSLDTEFGGNGEKRNQAFADYSRMTGDATSKHDVDLVLWPETMFYGSDGSFAINKYDPEMADYLRWEGMTLERWSNICEIAAMQLISSYGTKCLLGTNTIHYHQDSIDLYNSAAYFDETGKLEDVYHKTHPVMFGEYIPLGDLMPWIYRFTPIPGGLTPGEEPKSFAAGSLHVSPTICFENTVPQLVRQQVLELEQRGTPVQALVTLTNDGWFWGSSLLDLHLACGIFRAVENRRPMLIAANTGISAHIDDCGRVVDAAGKRVSRVIIAKVEGRSWYSVYTHFGDWFGFSCLFLCVVGVVAGYLGGPISDEVS